VAVLAVYTDVGSITNVFGLTYVMILDWTFLGIFTSACAINTFVDVQVGTIDGAFI
jgi:hypothetical protein